MYQTKEKEGVTGVFVHMCVHASTRVIELQGEAREDLSERRHRERPEE